MNVKVFPGEAVPASEYNHLVEEFEKLSRLWKAAAVKAAELEEGAKNARLLIGTLIRCAGGKIQIRQADILKEGEFQVAYDPKYDILTYTCRKESK
jgi:hypothetical protein